MKKHYLKSNPVGVEQLTSERKMGARAASGRKAEQGIALVITLILLSVITFMAITLLVVTRSEKGSVAVNADQTSAMLMNDEAIEHLKMMLIAPIIAFNNPFAADFLVSTNYVNPGGFIVNGAARTSWTNVNYFAPNGKLLAGNDALQNLQNQMYDPRPPVWITNRLFGSNEFRYWLDVNRNGQFDPTGLQPVIGTNGPIINTNGLVLSNYFVGDPQWVGVLEKPGFPHSPTNKYVGRYAYFAIPLSQTLDLNYIHNYAKDGPPAMPDKTDSFFRNMGVGTWEMNLAAFLVDLNTNIWQPLASPYRYYALENNYLTLYNSGQAFDDALALLKYRYNGNWRANLFSVNQMFGPKGMIAFGGDGIDGYSHGQAMLTTKWAERDNVLVNLGWAGSDNPNHFFTTQDLFDSTKTRNGAAPGPTFSDRLIASTTSSNTYDRTTYTRLLSQLATDSAPERDKLHLNYKNVDANGVVVPNAATNFTPWQPGDFFTNVATRLLANAGFSVGTGESPTNLLVVDNVGRTNLHIPIWPTNFYTPSVHRLLQLAANIYDATTNRTFGVANTTNGFNGFPTVLRPLFQGTGGRAGANNVFLVGFEEETDARLVTAPPPMRDLNNANDRATLRPNRRDLVYGFPILVGAKKGFPNFNELSMETAVTVTRKLQFIAPNVRDPKLIRPTQTNQMYVMTVSNVFGIEGWNSYSNTYPRGLQMIVGCDMTAVITNEIGKMLLTNRYIVGTNQNIAAWEGFKDINHPNNSFKVPFPPSTSHFLFMTNSTYVHAGDFFGTLTGAFEKNQTPPFALPHWWLNLNTRLRFILVDTGVTPNRIIDYVNLASADAPVDVTLELMQGADCTATYNPPRGQVVPDGLLWCTNRSAPSGPTFGSRLQIDVSAGLFDADWKRSQSIFPGTGLNDQFAAIDFFRTNFFGWPAKYGGHALYVTNVFYAPYTPTRTLYISTSWQANDPLVHYTVNDLQDIQNFQNTNRVRTDNVISQSKVSNVGRLNDRYEPWGFVVSNSKSRTTTAIQVKDPLVMRSDDWDFPTNKLPNIGWLGRVHRGTPWQTIFLKSPSIDATNWLKWTGNIQAITNYGQIDTNILNLPVATTLPATNWTYDLLFTFPTNDWNILELFTTAFNDNATRGRLSINQTNLPAWSALLSGVIALEADPKGSQLKGGAISNRPVVIEPVGAAGSASPLWQLVNAINTVRSGTNFNGSFKKLGDILSVPEFTVNSPFLNLTNVSDAVKPWSVNDAACERLPQQTLSLLNLDRAPRFLIYSWGQALKPANKSIVTLSGPAFGMCTNYQVTAEYATRTIVRLEGVPNNPHMVVEKFNVLPPD